MAWSNRVCSIALRVVISRPQVRYRGGAEYRRNGMISVESGARFGPGGGHSKL